MADMQGATDRWRRRIDRIDLVPRRVTIEPVETLALPALTPFLFQALERGLLGNLLWIVLGQGETLFRRGSKAAAV